jgi:hypothetical protein
MAILRERDMLDCLKLVHCHPGSQLQDIRRVKDAITELAHVYGELKPWVPVWNTSTSAADWASTTTAAAPTIPPR